jgi:hypothetical protein
MKKKTALFTALFIVVAGVIAIPLLSQNTFAPSQSAEGDTARTATANAKGDVFELAVSEKTVQKSDTCTVSIVVQSDEPMQQVQGELHYDATLLSYEDSDADIVGSEGVLTLNSTFAEAAKTHTYNITFQALELGECHLELANTSYNRYSDLSLVSESTATNTVTIIANDSASDDCTLAELLIGSGELNPVWDALVYDYTVEVPADTNTFTYSAVPSDSDAVVTAAGPDTLQTGDNHYTITVTAPSGNRADYHITVVK